MRSSYCANTRFIATRAHARSHGLRPPWIAFHCVRVRIFFAGIGLAMLLLGGMQVQATEMCVNTSGLLQAALALGQLQQAAFKIKIVQGAYFLDFGGNATADFAFSQPTTIAGGYTANCAARVVNPANTSVDFGGTATEVTFEQSNGAPSALLAFDGLTLKHGGRLDLIAGDYGQLGDDPGDIRLSNLRFTDFNNTSTDTVQANWPLNLLVYAGEARFENALIDHIVQQNGVSACAVQVQTDEDSRMRFINTTIDLSNSKKLCLGTWSSSGDYVMDIDNSIVWGSDGGAPHIVTEDGLDVASSFVIHVANSVFNDPIGGPASVQITAPLHGNPLWSAPASGDYHLLVASPAVNSGTVIVPVGLPATDIEGNVRWIGSAPDRGAYESPFNNATAYVVTTTADSGAGSLRDAITQANSLPNPATITFAIPGACPRVIGLASVLPRITSPTLIDATTQAGSSVNNATDAVNASLCVLLKPASGTLAYAFSVASGSDAASLALRGMGLGGFGQPVQLLGGANHVIAGNQFGGTVGGVALAGAGLYAITLGVNAGGSLIIGGSALADRNVIGGASFGGITVQSTLVSTPDQCQIVNNLIGLAPNAINALPNFTGIALGGVGCSVVGNRVAGNTKDNLWINGGSNNLVQRNIFGVALNDSGFIGGAGVRISGSNNIVGSSPTSAGTSLLANTIRYNLDGGVLVDSGTHNAVRGNLIYDNGLSGEGMDMDLGADGASANDANDLDNGANLLQNFPLVDHLYYPVIATSTATPSAVDGSPTTVDLIVSGHLNAQPGTYRIDAYFSTRCDNGAFHVSGRGHAQAWLGSAPLSIAAGGAFGNVSLPVTLPDATNAIVSLSATDALGNTSEIGTCYGIGNALDDRIFADDFEPIAGP